MKGVKVVERCSTFSRGTRGSRGTLFALLLGAVTIHCGGAPAATLAPPTTPAATATVATTAQTTAPPNPFQLPARLREDVSPPEVLRDPDMTSFRAAKKLPGIYPPSDCPAPATSKKKKVDACSMPPARAAALALPHGDAALADLETCSSFPPGYIRSLRAEIGKPECADLLVDDFIEKPKQGTPAGLMHVLVGQSLAAKLLRTVHQAPVAKGPIPKDKLGAFYTQVWKPWFETQRTTLEQLSQVAISLYGYGKAIAATEAGYAELRMVQTVRSGTVPQDFTPEQKQIYETALEDALAPIKNRGQAATLTGFGIMAQLDLPSSPHVLRARALLAQMYGGRRIDALDALILPTAGLRLDEESTFAETAPYHYELLVPRKKEVDASASLAERLQAAELRLRRGTTFWRAVDFDRILALVGADLAKDERARLYGALALALRQGPQDALRFMAARTPAELNLTHTEALDLLATEKRTTSGMAAFNAALLREISPPNEGTREHFLDVGKRFDTAAQLLEGPVASAAQERAEAARKLAAAIK